jgi:hypothetical protein
MDNRGRFDGAGGRGGGWRTCEDVVLYSGLSLIAHTGMKYKNNTCVGISNFIIPRLARAKVLKKRRPK